MMPLLAFKLILALYSAIAATITLTADTPHPPESRPDVVEACFYEDHSALWLEIATPTSYVCDGSGTIIAYLALPNGD